MTGPATRFDGRHARKASTRERIIDAVRQLADDGDWRASGLAVARRAKCSTRSIFEHFATLDELRATALTEGQLAAIGARLRPLSDVDLGRAFIIRGPA